MIGSIEHDLIAKHIEGIKKSYINIDKKGIAKASINGLAKLMVETKPGEWITARKIFFTVTGKVKLSIDDTIDNKFKYLMVEVRSLEFSMLRMFKGD